MATLNNNQIASVINSAYTQMTGADTLTTLNLKDFVDTGNAKADIIGSTENFTKALINVLIRNWFSDTSYRSEYNDPFYEDSEAFGAIIQFIDVTVPQVKESRAWTNYTSGETTVGQYTVFLPIVETQLFGKSVSWELPIAITDNQWNTAFDSEDKLRGFVDFIWLCMDNALLQHLEDCSAMNRNNFMAEKLAYQSAHEGVGMHAVNLVKAYCDKNDIAEMTVEQFRNNKECLIFASQQMMLIKNYMKKQTSMFNTSDKVRFTPEDRIVVEILSDFESDIVYNAMSSTFHDELIDMPLHRSVPAWQSMNDLSFNGVSSIDINNGSDGTNIKQSGIVGLIVDKWAIIHTFIDTYLASQRMDLNRLTLYAYQYTDRYINNLTMNGCVLYLEDVTAE